jgi:hypothetical protein
MHGCRRCRHGVLKKFVLRKVKAPPRSGTCLNLKFSKNLKTVILKIIERITIASGKGMVPENENAVIRSIANCCMYEAALPVEN